jgi:enoyl-CoA hydratase/carnithine racemase
MSSEADLRVERDGPTATVWLDRPGKRNAMTYEMWRALADSCATVAADPSIRVLVLRSTSEHFCAGADIAELSVTRLDDQPSFMAVNGAAEDALARLPRPTVAAISGDCIGGGTALAIDCDLRVATADARFGITPARLGIAYPPASVERATRLLGRGAASWLLFTGELIDAAEALRIGLVHEVVADRAALGERVAAIAATLAARSLVSQLAAKEMIASVAAAGSVDPALAVRWAATVAESADSSEGIAAFVERRPPRFTWTPR